MALIMTKNKKNLIQFRYVERLSITVILITLSVDLMLIYWKGAQIDWYAYAKLSGLCLLIVAGGIVYRVIDRSERIASTLICSGLLVAFSMVLALFNYLLLPVSAPFIDEYIAKADAILGFHWPDIMIWASKHPIISVILKISYMSTMAQLSILIALLGLTGRRQQMDVLLLTVIISATIAICFWGLFPSSGAMSVHNLPAEIEMAVAPVVGQEYGAELRRIATEGPGVIAPYEIRGLIGFPSYHASLAFVALFASFAIKRVFPIFLILNLLILPATLIHGGHHLLDLFAGFLLFWGAWMVAKYIIQRNATMENLPQFVSA